MKLLSILVFLLYIFLINYFANMLIFDYRKYIKKDKYLKNVKFNMNWKEQYYKNKYQSKTLDNDV